MRQTRLFLFLAILLCSSKAFAAYDFIYNDVAYTITSTDDKTVSVAPIGKFSGGYTSNSITIPATAEKDGITYAVTAIGQAAFRACKKLKAVTIPSSVTSIGTAAFVDCSGLTSVTIPDGVTTIGTSAFQGCTGMTSLTISSSLTSIDEATFGACWGLTSITIPSSVTKISDHAFVDCTGLTSITIPDGVTQITTGAFQNCTGLTSITIPSNVTFLGEDVFDGCTNLATVISLVENPTSVVASYFTTFNNIKSGAILYVPLGTKTAYANADNAYWSFTENYVKEFVATITLPSSGYATYCSTEALDFSEIDELDAYTAKSYDPTTGVLNAKQYDQIPASTGMLLHGTGGVTYPLVKASGTPALAETNLFVGVTVNTEIGVTNGLYTNLILATVDDATGFYHLDAGGTLAAHRAYLPVLTSEYNAQASSKKITINLEKGGTTDITTIELNNDTEDTIYNLQGQRVQNPEHGIYIVKGKKTYIK